MFFGSSARLMARIMSTAPVPVSSSKKPILWMEPSRARRVKPTRFTRPPFSVKVGSTGQVFDIPADKTVVQVLESHGIDIPMSCEQGVCGTCLTRVLEGVPDHRDMFLTEEEQACNDQFTPCCSRSKSPMLVLDI